MSDKNQENQRQQREEEQKRQQEEERRKQQEQQQEQGGQQPNQQAKPGSRISNPAEPYAQTEAPERPDASSFLRAGADTTHPDGYPKLKYHPVHGGITVKDPGEESQLYPRTDWFDSPELADAARTHTEAEIVRINNQVRKLKELEERDHPIVRNSVQADESIRRAYPEPL